MEIATFLALATACAPQVHPVTARALVAVESAFNPSAIGVVGGVLARQPSNRAEALATVKTLHAAGWNYSVGLGQINVSNFSRLGLTADAAFDPCMNLAAMQSVLAECYGRTSADADPQSALRQALSCYYSGNFTTGMRHGYVGRVVAASTPSSRRITSPRRARTSSRQE